MADFQHPVLLTIALCLGVTLWLALNSPPGYTNLLHEVDTRNHTRIEEPRLVVNLTQFFNLPEEYFSETTVQERLYTSLRADSLFSPFPPYQSYSSKKDLLLSGQPVANISLCFKDLTWINDWFNEHNNDLFDIKGPVARNMTIYLESFGQVKSNFHEGVVVDWPGSMKFCLKTSLDYGRINTRYCVGHFKMKSWPSEEIVYPLPRIRLGICLPETCDSSANSDPRIVRLIENVAKIVMPPIYYNTVELDNIFCLPDERSPMRQIPTGGWILIFILIGWLSIVILATALHERYKENNDFNNKHDQQLEAKKLGFTVVPGGNIKDIQIQSQHEPIHEPSIFVRFVRALSLRNSIKALLGTSQTAQHRLSNTNSIVDLRSLNFIKGIMAIAIVFGHGFIIELLYATSIDSRRSMAKSSFSHALFGICLFVDTFYVIAGSLMSYTLLGKHTKSQLANPLVWFWFNLHIFLRVGPLFMLTYWFNRLLGPLLGSGPKWDYGVEYASMRGYCRTESWWRSIPYLGRYGIPTSCNPPSWFIVNYIQMALFVPALTYCLTALSGKIMKILMVAYIVIISLSHIAIKISQQKVVPIESFSMYGGFMVAILEKHQPSGYMDTLGRLTPMVIGCCGGYLLSQYKEGAIGKWPRWLSSKTAIKVNLILLLISFMLPLIGYKLYVLTHTVGTLGQFIAGNAVAYSAWPILNVILIINLTTRYQKSLVVRFMRHGFWQSLNRLGFCIFLTHFEVLQYAVTAVDGGLSHGDTVDAVLLAGFAIFVSLIISVVLYLTVEQPLNAIMSDIEKSFLKRNSRGTHKESVASIQ